LDATESSPTGEGASLESSSGHPLLAFLTRLVGWLAVLAFIGGLDPDPAVSLFLK